MASSKTFSKWVHLTDESLHDVPQKTGIYEIRAPRSIKSINRLIGKDEKGILEIGQSSDLRIRLRAFYNAAKGGEESHSEGIRFFKLKLARKLGIKIGELEVRFKEVKKSQLKTTEEGHLLRYEERHGELPPLNHSGGKKV